MHDTEIIPAVTYTQPERRPVTAGQVAGWVGVAILLLIAGGVALIDWRILHL